MHGAGTHLLFRTLQILSSKRVHAISEAPLYQAVVHLEAATKFACQKHWALLLLYYMHIPNGEAVRLKEDRLSRDMAAELIREDEDAQRPLPDE